LTLLLYFLVKLILNKNSVYQMASFIYSPNFQFSLGYTITHLFSIDECVHLTLLHYSLLLTFRHTHFTTNANSNCVAGRNALSNRLNHLNGKILLEQLNYSINQYKIEYKKSPWQLLLKWHIWCKIFYFSEIFLNCKSNFQWNI
jgi:hypothetical protein